MEERGQVLVEYAMIIVFVALVVIGVLSLIPGHVLGMLDAVNSSFP
jgi:Flp pilus assembly pilin Flp